jgi:hypothetical protein
MVEVPPQIFAPAKSAFPLSMAVIAEQISVGTGEY